MSVVSIPARFCGPAGYGNGGFSCGVFAAAIDGPAEVTLRSPVRLETAYTVLERDGGLAVEDAEGALVAEVRPVEPLTEIEPPLRPDPEQARAASEGSPFRTDRHPYPGCFVCGPQHSEGLHLHVGSLPADETVAAAPFTPDDSLPSADGALAPELVWAVLDCPSYVPSLWSETPVLLGRLAVEILAPVEIGADHIAVAWERGQDGRKLHSASALIDADGRLVARGRALWIRVGSTP